MPKTWSRCAALATLFLLVLGAPLVDASSASATTASSPGRHGSGHHARRYVALGDSYSSGEGSGRYYRRTDTAANACHRSPLAYAPLLDQSRRSLRLTDFVACSGATTHDLYAPNHSYAGEPAQLTALTTRTKVVTLTIGGNDLGFTEIVGACLQTAVDQRFRCSENPLLTGAVAARTAALAGLATVPDAQGFPITAVGQVLADIAARAPRAKIYLAGYPELFGSDADDYTRDPSAPSGSSCVLNAGVAARIDYADAQWFLRSTRTVNAVFAQAVQQARAAGVRATYVAPSTFDGHGLCDEYRSYIQPLVITGGQIQPESLHPTVAGQAKGYARAFRHAGL